MRLAGGFRLVDDQRQDLGRAARIQDIVGARSQGGADVGAKRGAGAKTMVQEAHGESVGARSAPPRQE